MTINIKKPNCVAIFVAEIPRLETHFLKSIDVIREEFHLRLPTAATHAIADKTSGRYCSSMQATHLDFLLVAYFNQGLEP